MNKEKLNDIVCESSSDYAVLNDAYNYIEDLEQQCKKQKEVIDKAKLYINSTKYSDIIGLEKHSIKEFWFIEELLDILNEVSE